MGSLKIKQKKKAFIPYTNKQSHMFAQSIQNCQKELKEMELKAFDDGFEDGKNWSDVLNFVILFYVMHELHGWGWKRYMKSVKRINNYINDINSGKTSLSEMVDDLEKKHHIQICDDYKELIDSYFKVQYGKHKKSGVVPDYSLSHFMSEEIRVNLAKNTFNIPH